MFRALLTSRWLGLTALLLAFVTATVFLGLWQLGVARDEGRRQAVAAAESLPEVPLEHVTSPHSAFEAEFSNRRVSVTGSYAAELGFVVPDRRLGGRTGSWVVTPLVTPAGTVVVLRGFVDGAPVMPPPPPAGQVVVHGTLGPGESPRAGGTLPERQRNGIDLAQLVNEWPGQLYNVVLLAASEADSGGPVVAPGVERVPPPEVEAPLQLRNLAYAIQWWVFGFFAVWMWWKMLRAEQPATEPDGEREGASA